MPFRLQSWLNQSILSRIFSFLYSYLLCAAGSLLEMTFFMHALSPGGNDFQACFKGSSVLLSELGEAL